MTSNFRGSQFVQLGKKFAIQIKAKNRCSGRGSTERIINPANGNTDFSLSKKCAQARGLR
jgi:hypothetical protein